MCAHSNNSRYDSQLRKLVELYGVWDAYRTVAETCTLAGFGPMVAERKELFTAELRRYAHKRYGGGAGSMARAMDDVLIRRNQLTIF